MRPVPEYDAKSWLLKAMRETAHAMESLIWDADGDVLDERPEPDEWSCKELLSHMSEMERRYTGWIEAIVRVEHPELRPFDGDSLEPTTPLDETTTFDLMDEFGVQRQQTVYLLWSLDADDWDRGGCHPYVGEMSVTRIAREMNEHDLAHLWQLRHLCDRFEAASV